MPARLIYPDQMCHPVQRRERDSGWDGGGEGRVGEGGTERKREGKGEEREKR